MTKDKNLKSSLNKEVRKGLIDDSIKKDSDLITYASKRLSWWWLLLLFKEEEQ